MQPALEDLEFDQAAKEAALRTRISDFFTDGVLFGLQLSIAANQVTLQPGIGYVQGERIRVTEPTLALDGLQDGFVWIRFIQIESHPESHFITGESHNTRVSDSFEMVRTSNDVPIDNGILLGEIQSGYVIDRRSFMELKLSRPESILAPANLTVTTGFEADLNYTPNLESQE